ncbi:hypothetical protein QBC37DRAFT_297600 [Rhypophila decipiens]|uniref:Rhodopsin domain-containing protein n=1 Tax=Rhypophila decipiens TaxID=261697 RepID=A0AAN6XWK4_9PEZI|nr:hypothetical protein QBC37DRAFT_297600 [Rhypophila decipiens]
MNPRGIEAFVLMAVGIVFVVLRIFARIKLVGFKKLQADDYLMVLAGAVYVASTALAYLTAVAWEGLANHGLTQEQRRSLDPKSQEYRYRVNGSKGHLAGWQAYVFCLWAIKTAWFVFYQRLLGILLSRRRVCCGYFVLAATYMAVVLTLLLSCHPLDKYWQIYPDPGPSCLLVTSKVNIITTLVLNGITDVYIMAIPIPMILRGLFSRIKKIGLVLLFSGGIYVTTAGVVRGVLMMGHPDEAGQLSGTWALRELSVAMVMSNIPFLVPLVRRLWFGPVKESSKGRPPEANGAYRRTTNNIPAPTGAERKRTSMAGPPVDVDIDDSDFDPRDEQVEVARSLDHDDWDREGGRSLGATSTWRP